MFLGYPIACKNVLCLSRRRLGGVECSELGCNCNLAFSCQSYVDPVPVASSIPFVFCGYRNFGYLYFKIHKKMMPHSSVLLIILIAYSAHSFGVTIPYKNNTWLYYSYKENITITCSGTDEVAWRLGFFWMRGNYTVIEQTPLRKIIHIKNASIYNCGIYECVSAKNSDEFMRLHIMPDNTCYPHNGTQPAIIGVLGSHPVYKTPEGSFDEPFTP
ncbi:uncharacterized protein LOC135849509 isoform X2 [Planococcus citri]|uniref:uncharacterized protein LOC135849509 isoform X2 n=1 Tax=Planococcus citri TaxID=170843 RepID=UPI0031F74DA7